MAYSTKILSPSQFLRRFEAAQTPIIPANRDVPPRHQIPRTLANPSRRAAHP